MIETVTMMTMNPMTTTLNQPMKRFSGILPRKKKPDMNPPVVSKVPYEVDMTKATDMTEQAASPNPKDTINIDSGDDNGNDDKDE